jgi:hypothetical protein
MAGFRHWCLHQSCIPFGKKSYDSEELLLDHVRREHASGTAVGGITPRCSKVDKSWRWRKSLDDGNDPKALFKAAMAGRLAEVKEL